MATPEDAKSRERDIEAWRRNVRLLSEAFHQTEAHYTDHGLRLEIESRKRLRERFILFNRAVLQITDPVVLTTIPEEIARFLREYHGPHFVPEVDESSGTFEHGEVVRTTLILPEGIMRRGYFEVSSDERARRYGGIYSGQIFNMGEDGLVIPSAESGGINMTLIDYKREMTAS